MPRQRYFSKDYIGDDYPWPHTSFLVVSKEYIKCFTWKQLATGKAITPDRGNLLIKRVELDLDRERVARFTDVARRFFGGV